jgi:hypothetical protein
MYVFDRGVWDGGPVWISVVVVVTWGVVVAKPGTSSGSGIRRNVEVSDSLGTRHLPVLALLRSYVPGGTLDEGCAHRQTQRRLNDCVRRRTLWRTTDTNDGDWSSIDCSGVIVIATDS